MIEDAFFVTIDVFIKVYIRFRNARYFPDVDKNKYKLVQLYNIRSRMIYRIDRGVVLNQSRSGTDLCTYAPDRSE